MLEENQFVLNRAFTLAQTIDTMPTGSFAISVPWIFPSFIPPAMSLACAAGDAQFMISQGLPPAVAGCLQTSPYFSLETGIELEAGKDPEENHDAKANFTASIDLLVAIIGPVIFARPAYFTHELSALASLLLFFVFIFPPQTEETAEDIKRIGLPILARSFPKTMLASGRLAVVSQFVFLLWTASVSSIRETAGGFCRVLKIRFRPAAPANEVSLNLNEWAMLPSFPWLVPAGFWQWI